MQEYLSRLTCCLSIFFLAFHLIFVCHRGFLCADGQRPMGWRVWSSSSSFCCEPHKAMDHARNGGDSRPCKQSKDLLNSAQTMVEGLSYIVYFLQALTVPHGKALVAKELMAWTGSDLYYHDGGMPNVIHFRGRTERRRYLAYDGHALSMNVRDVCHQPHYMRAALTFMVSVAKATGRTLILPTFFHDAFYLYAWNHLDLKSVEAVGVEWRETNFLRTLRLRRASDLATNNAEGIFGWGGPWDAVRVSVIEGAVAFAASSTSPEFEAKRTSAVESDAPGTWKFAPLGRQNSVLGNAFWPLVVEDPQLRDPPLMLLRFPALDGATPGALRSDFGGPRWIDDLFGRLKWCKTERSGGMFKPKSASLSMSSDDCYGDGQPVKAGPV